MRAWQVRPVARLPCPCNAKAPARLQALLLALFRSCALAHYVSTLFTPPLDLSVATMNFFLQMAAVAGQFTRAPESARTRRKCLLAAHHASLACRSSKP